MPRFWKNIFHPPKLTVCPCKNWWFGRRSFPFWQFVPFWGAKLFVSGRLSINDILAHRRSKALIGHVQVAGVPDRAEPDGRLARLQYFAFCFLLLQIGGRVFFRFFSPGFEDLLPQKWFRWYDEWQKRCDSPMFFASVFFAFQFLRVKRKPAPNGVNTIRHFLGLFYQKNIYLQHFSLCH